MPRKRAFVVRVTESPGCNHLKAVCRGITHSKAMTISIDRNCVTLRCPDLEAPLSIAQMILQELEARGCSGELSISLDT